MGFEKPRALEAYFAFGKNADAAVSTPKRLFWSLTFADFLLQSLEEDGMGYGDFGGFADGDGDDEDDDEGGDDDDDDAMDEGSCFFSFSTINTSRRPPGLLIPLRT